MAKEMLLAYEHKGFMITLERDTQDDKAIIYLTSTDPLQNNLHMTFELKKQLTPEEIILRVGRALRNTYEQIATHEFSEYIQHGGKPQ